MNKEQSESENHRRPIPELGKIWIISDVFVSFELQSLLVRHLWEGEKSLIIKVDCNASML